MQKYEYLPLKEAKVGDVVEATKSDERVTKGKLYIILKDSNNGSIGHYIRDTRTKSDGIGLYQEYWKLVKTKPGSEAKVGDEIILVNDTDYFKTPPQGNPKAGSVWTVTKIESDRTIRYGVSIPGEEGEFGVQPNDVRVLCESKDYINSYSKLLTSAELRKKAKKGDTVICRQLHTTGYSLSKIVELGKEYTIAYPCPYPANNKFSALGININNHACTLQGTDMTDALWELISFKHEITELIHQNVGKSLEELFFPETVHNASIGMVIRILTGPNKNQIATWNGSDWNSDEEKSFWIHTQDEMVELISFPTDTLQTETVLSEPTIGTSTYVNVLKTNQIKGNEMKDLDLEIKVNGKAVCTGTKVTKQKTDLQEAKKTKVYAEYFNQESGRVHTGTFKNEDAAIQLLATREYIGCTVMIFTQSSIQRQKLQLEKV